MGDSTKWEWYVVLVGVFSTLLTLHFLWENNSNMAGVFFVLTAACVVGLPIMTWVRKYW